MLASVVAALRCPVCDGALASAPSALRCAAGHAFDVARQGYVHLLAGPARGGDSAAMIDARARFLAAGHFAPLSAALADLAAAHAAPTGIIVEVGAGTGHHLAAVLDRLADRDGLALDLSRYAARRAARAHPRIAAVVADATRKLPLATASAALVLDIFAPRHAAELARVLSPRGALIVVTPRLEHLAELRAPLGLLAVDPDKERRLAERLGPTFERGEATPLTFALTLRRDEVAAAVAMGPSAWHTTPQAIAAAVAALPDPCQVTASFNLEVDRALRPR